MAAYLIVDTLLDDSGLYEQYNSKARPPIEKFGGEYLARGGLTLRDSSTRLRGGNGIESAPAVASRFA